MKNKQPILYLLALFMLIIGGCKKEDNNKIRNGERYYYGFEGKVYINKLNNKLVVKYEDNEAAKESTSHVASIAKGSEFLWIDERIVVITIEPKVVNDLMTLLTKDMSVLAANPVYTLDSDSDPDPEIFYTDEFSVKFKPTTSQAEIEKINGLYDAQITEETEIYTLLTVPRLVDALEIANKYQESGLVVYAEPNFYMKMVMLDSTSEYLPTVLYYWGVRVF